MLKNNKKWCEVLLYYDVILIKINKLSLIL